jgi:acetyl esterase/lipase
VRWLRANAAQYDPTRIGTLGFSSGAQLSCLLGVTRAADGLEGDEGNPQQSSRVDAVVSFFGPTDFTLQSWRDRGSSNCRARVRGPGRKLSSSRAWEEAARFLLEQLTSKS